MFGDEFERAIHDNCEREGSLCLCRFSIGVALRALPDPKVSRYGRTDFKDALYMKAAIHECTIHAQGHGVTLEETKL